MKKFFYITLVFAISLFTSSAYAGYLDDVGASTPSTSATPAASAPEAAKPAAVDTSKLLHCAKNYGRVILDEVPSPVLPAWFQRVNSSATLVPPTLQHAVKQTGCLTLVEKGTAGVRMKLKVEVPPPTVSEVSRKKENGALGVIRLFVPVPISSGNSTESPTYFFSEAQVMMTIVDTTTGESLAFVIGNGKAEDVSLGAALLSVDTPAVLNSEASKSVSMQVVASAFADAMNQLVPVMDKLNASAPAK